MILLCKTCKHAAEWHKNAFVPIQELASAIPCQRPGCVCMDFVPTWTQIL